MRRRAFTLVEVLVVCALVATIMGIGVAFLGSLTRVVAVQAERGRIDSLVREAHNFAASDEARAWIVLDPAENSITVRAMTLVGVWHLEDDRGTGYSPTQELSIHGGRLSDPSRGEQGKIGRCIVFDKGSGRMDMGRSHLYDSRDGVAVEAWIFPTAAGNSVLFEKGAGLRLSIQGGFLEGNLRGVGVVSSRTRNLAIPTGRWSRVKMSFDGTKLELFVNGAIADSQPPPKPAKKKPGKTRKETSRRNEELAYEPDTGAPLVAATRFTGMIDEIRVWSCIDPQFQKLDPNVAIDPDKTTDLEIHFVPGGGLDPEYHPSDVRIVLTTRSDPNRMEVIEIGRLGAVR